MDFQLLNTELQSNDYAGLTDDQTVAKLNAATTIYEMVPTADIQNLISKSMIGVKLNTRFVSTVSKQAVGESDASYALREAQVNQLRGLAGNALDILQGQIAALDVSPTSSIAYSGGLLVSAGVITQAELDSVTALGKRVSSLAQMKLGAGIVLTEQDITRARLQPKVDATKALITRATQSTNHVIGTVSLVLESLERGVDTDVPDWAALSALFNEVGA